MNDLTKEMIQLLDCPCEVFEPMKKDRPIMEAYLAARDEGKRNGFVPVLLVAEENLLENLRWAIQEDEEQPPALEKIRAWRKEQLALPLEDGKEVLDARVEEVLEWVEDEDEEDYWERVTAVDTSPSRPLPKYNPKEDCFSGYWDWGCDREKTCEIILAKIPVRNPWEVFCWIPMGGWNECPDYTSMMAIFKYWYETYQVAPAVFTSDVLEAYAEKPAQGWTQTAKLAKEQYSFCCDIVDQGVATVDALAALLHQKKIWYFWWD